MADKYLVDSNACATTLADLIAGCDNDDNDDDVGFQEGLTPRRYSEHYLSVFIGLVVRNFITVGYN